MSMQATNAGTTRRHTFSLGQIWRRRIANAARKRRVRLEMAELSRLPRHRLRDMGLEDYAQPPEPSFPAHWR